MIGLRRALTYLCDAISDEVQPHENTPLGSHLRAAREALKDGAVVWLMMREGWVRGVYATEESAKTAADHDLGVDRTRIETVVHFPLSDSGWRSVGEPGEDGHVAHARVLTEALPEGERTHGHWMVQSSVVQD